MIPVLFSFFSINNPVDQAVAFRFHTCYRNRRHANGKWLGVINGLSVVEFYIEENIGEREPRDYIASQTPLSVQQNQRNQSKHAQCERGFIKYEPCNCRSYYVEENYFGEILSSITCTHGSKQQYNPIFVRSIWV
ncbi:hypothetical protein RirG_037160 [Rhizophagus irregularis DAOM 197198w]|uniref:Uncharacterized protein n=1 Tax=Rhizophagus irregularis (strain DAOM 197198w) TaxID=1432141 RepID=A0A015K8V4_RHIIW|nr:hypothetical protein RirG_037160 [Rhizophagus irregularis DAOM 197198w]